MRRPLRWLSVLLSLALIFNGIAAASASTRMLLQHAGGQTSSIKARVHDHMAASQDPPCHEASFERAATATLASHGSNEAAGDGKPTTDCCKAGACRCQCVHQSQGVTALVLLAEPVILRTTSLRKMKSAHAEATLLPLIRPPIG